MRIAYTLRGVLDVPEGFHLSDEGHLILPDGQRLEVWESFNLYHPEHDTTRHVGWSDLADYGLIQDGDPTEYEEVEATDQIWPLP